MVSEKTVTKEKLNSYELIVILKPDLAEEKLETAIENIKKSITGKGGTIQEALKWGKRRLAYEIKHCKEGVYILYHFQTKASQNRDLETYLKISDDVLRHLLIKIA
jgi:small subunit ribosomal protein S6